MWRFGGWVAFTWSTWHKWLRWSISGEPRPPSLPFPSNVFFSLPRLVNQFDTVYGIEFKLGELDITTPLSCTNLVAPGRATMIVSTKSRPLWWEDLFCFVLSPPPLSFFSPFCFFFLVGQVHYDMAPFFCSITVWTICIERIAKAFNHVQ